MKMSFLYKILNLNKFGYEKNHIEEYLNDKISYKQGVQEFEKKFPDLPQRLKANLKHEAGLAMIAKNEEQLLQYALHCYKQVESIYNEIFESFNEVRDKNDKNQYNRIKIYNYLHPTNTKWSKLSIINKNIIEHEIKVNFASVIFTNNDGVTKTFSQGSTIGFCSNTNQSILYIEDSNKEVWKVQKSQVIISGSRRKRDHSGYFVFERLSIRDKESFFKKAFYFDLNSPPAPRLTSVQLNAFFSMKHYRDIISHNISSNSSEINFYDAKLSKEDMKYIDQPDIIVKSNYYQRYVDVVIKLYSDYLQNPHF